jgi:hypothetical protein
VVHFAFDGLFMATVLCWFWILKVLLAAAERMTCILRDSLAATGALLTYWVQIQQQ